MIWKESGFEGKGTDLGAIKLSCVPTLLNGCWLLLRLEMMGMFLVTSRGSGGRKVGRSTSDREEPRTRVSWDMELVETLLLVHFST